ncbi:MAG: hypothetical protein ACLGG0_01175 [Bacteriovoracia bacterium]
MKRIALITIVILVAVVAWWKSSDNTHVTTNNDNIHSPILVASHTPPLRQPAAQRVLPGIPVERKSGREAMIQLPREVAFVNEKTPIVQNEVEWKWLEGAVAVKKSALPPGVPVISQRPGFVIVASSELPANMVSFPLVERTDNGVKGIFTGVIKAMGGASLESAGQFLSQCPVEMVESFPSIKSYLLKVHSQDELEESMSCLKATGLFKHLEWEILVSPNVQQ